ncbi:MAG: TlpA family protein disulfide reductase [Candidatus Eisenbacteria bacterium]|uniref:TlpA family protein disulfide reductase n=1 Tax=Eiseniibacteriota bacterium TaxID=2212470 RepID=A0A538UBC2_UNCEI|nr:MAG: TlpA family protein disulfide reductase [Candidatus Eisenbacteria bacterium]
MTLASRRVTGAGRARALLALVLLLAASAPARALGGTVVGAGIGVDEPTLRRVLREHPLRTIHGETMTLDALRGEVVVVNFWATWCPPCRRELARLDALESDIGRRGARVLAVSVDRDPANVRRFVRRQRLRLPVAVDGPDGLARELDLSSLPFTMVLDREGRVAFTTLGAADATVASLVERTQQLVASKPVVAEGERR